MVLRATFVRQPRHVYYCDWCGRKIDGSHIYMYGSAETEKPWALRLHTTENCRPPDNDPKVRAALAKAAGS